MTGLSLNEGSPWEEKGEAYVERDQQLLAFPNSHIWAFLS